MIARYWIAAFALGALVLIATAVRIFGAPEFWVDNEWITVIAETQRDDGGRHLLELTALCRQQGLPEYIITYLDANGAVTGQEKSGKYCPAPGELVIFSLPLPETGTWRVEFSRAQGAM